MSTLAVTVVGDDRPGIVAAVTGALSGVGVNLEDTTMTVLRGHFAMTLVVRSPRPAAEVAAALAPVAARSGVVVDVREVSESPRPALDDPGEHLVLSLHGADRPGIVSAVTGLVADQGGNITDLTTRLVGDLYVLTLELDLAGDVQPLADRLDQVARELGVIATLHPADVDVL